MWQGELNDCLLGNLEIIILLSSYGGKYTGFILFLPGVVETENQSVGLSQKMKMAKFRPDHMEMMHVL